MDVVVVSAARNRIEPIDLGDGVRVCASELLPGYWLASVTVDGEHLLTEEGHMPDDAVRSALWKLQRRHGQIGNALARVPHV